jgi:hypothetical protein
MTLTRIFGVGMLLALTALPVRAGDLKLEFRDGRVTLLARDVSVRQILAEWAKVGGTQIVNLERVSANPVTMQFEGVSERQALEVILRSMAGYVAAPRRPEHSGRSVYDRILVLAVSNPPAVSPRPGPSPAPFPIPREVTAPAPGPLFPTPADDDNADADDDVNLTPRPGTLTPGMPVAPTMPTTPGAAPQTPRATVPGGTSVPGVVVPVPQPSNQPQTAQPPNPDR